MKRAKEELWKAIVATTVLLGELRGLQARCDYLRRMVRLAEAMRERGVLP